MGKKIGTEEFSYIYPSIRRHLLVKRKRSKSVNKGEFDLHCYVCTYGTKTQRGLTVKNNKTDKDSEVSRY